MQVLFTASAERQIENLYNYIAPRSGPRRADVFVDRIVAFCGGLETFPHRGTRRNDLLPGLRTIGFERRVTIAFTVEDHVLIQGVFYAGRNLSTWRPG